MSFVSPSASLLATCGGNTVKLFDVTVDSGDPCTLSYTPSPGSQVNCVRWNHTNLVVASAGDDKKISLWHKNGQNMGTLPLVSNGIGEFIASINFSNKSSRYICSGGSDRSVRIWDLQRKRCIKWLSGHTDSITGVTYNCKDEHLASISIKGDLTVHNLASGARAAHLKDPHEQALRVLEYSRLSRHILVTSGDDGSVHLWDTTGRNPKISWMKQHSAPTTGLCFSPSSDKIVASVGLDKKLYTFDSGTKKPVCCIPYVAPFSSLAYSGDGNILAAGTNSGRIVFYDVRSRPQPFTVLCAYSNSEAVTSICWQRLKPVIVSENNCATEIAILGDSCEDSILMPDPLPSAVTSNFPSATTGSSSRLPLQATTTGLALTTYHVSAANETPSNSRVRPGGFLSKLQAPRSSYSSKDDMDIFSPLVDVQPITPSLGNWWDDLDEEKKDSPVLDLKSEPFSPSFKGFFSTEGYSDPHPISDWRSGLIPKQDEAPTAQLTSSAVSSPNSAFVSSPNSESSLSITPPEVWGGNTLPDKLTHHHSRFHPSIPLETGLNSTNLHSNITSRNETSVASEFSSFLNSSSVPASFGTRTLALSSNPELPGGSGPALSAVPQRYSIYADRINTTSSFSDVMGSAVTSPKSKKTGAETREDLIHSILLRQGKATATGIGSFPATSGITSQSLDSLNQTTDHQQGASFSLLLVQRTLEETLGSVQKSIHEDVKNLHIDLLRQFHLQEMEMSTMMSAVLERQEELIREVQSLRRENQQLRQLL